MHATPTALAAADATFVDGMARASVTLGITTLPPLTRIGVATLAEPDTLIEVEAIAVID
ncbi:hypothetical protein NIIDNTM18_41330 [Mycolicibacterium litorale]|uniref:Uncharacterized protein n=1 Tax=Mycolicibacterium litorale TaxID=758802 RepID=A0A6S6P8K6_9MYCO|nr:hypothetical protein NIIDNTM18_41330 [Mycolicibacterium litorale]